MRRLGSPSGRADAAATRTRVFRSLEVPNYRTVVRSASRQRHRHVDAARRAGLARPRADRQRRRRRDRGLPAVPAHPVPRPVGRAARRPARPPSGRPRLPGRRRRPRHRARGRHHRRRRRGVDGLRARAGPGLRHRRRRPGAAHLHHRARRARGLRQRPVPQLDHAQPRPAPRPGRRGPASSPPSASAGRSPSTRCRSSRCSSASPGSTRRPCGRRRCSPGRGARSRRGCAYVWRHPELRACMVLVAAVALFGQNFRVVLPLLARDSLGGGAEVYGYLTSAMGAGAVIGALVSAAREHVTALVAAGVGGHLRRGQPAARRRPRPRARPRAPRRSRHRQHHVQHAGAHHAPARHRALDAGPRHLAARHGLPRQHPHRRPADRAGCARSPVPGPGCCWPGSPPRSPRSSSCRSCGACGCCARRGRHGRPSKVQR